MRRIHALIGLGGFICLLLLNACSAPPASAGVTEVAVTAMSIGTLTLTPTPNETNVQQTIDAIVDRRFTQAFQTQGASTATQAFVNMIDARVHLLQTGTALAMPTGTPTPTLDPTDQQISLATAVSNRSTEIAQVVMVQTQVAATYATRDALINPLLTATAQARATPTPAAPDGTALQSTLDAAIIKRLTEIANQTQVNVQYSTRIAIVDPLLTATALGIANPTATFQSVQQELTKNLNALTVESAERATEIASFSGGSKAITGIAFAPDVFTLATSGNDNTVRVYDTITTAPRVNFAGNTDRVGVAFSPDGTLIAAPSSDGTVRILETATGLQRFVLEQPVNPLNGRRQAMTSVAFSPDGARLASGNADGTVILWNIRSGTKILTLTVPRGTAFEITSVAFSADGTRVVAGNEIGQVLFWEAVTNFQITSFKGEGSPIVGLILSSDGKSVISAARNGEILVRDIASGTVKTALRNAPPIVTSAAVNTDLSLIAVGGNDGIIRLYDLANNKLLASLKGHTAAVSMMAFSADGFRLASGANDGVIKLWAVPKG
jgi:hypothetical protein